jgi:3-oxoacyl-[acyl-carrier-protein] synthase II
MRRVVVTGMGLVSPLGVGVEHSWKALLDGKSGARRVDTFDVEDMPCKIASMVPRGDGTDGSLNIGDFLEPKEQRKIGDFIAYGIAAAVFLASAEAAYVTGQTIHVNGGMAMI